MPTNVKVIVSGAALVVALGLAYWSGSPIRAEFSTLILGMAIFMIAAMWIFPEAGVKKNGIKRQ